MPVSSRSGSSRLREGSCLRPSMTAALHGHGACRDPWEVLYRRIYCSQARTSVRIYELSRSARRAEEPRMSDLRTASAHRGRTVSRAAEAGPGERSGTTLVVGAARGIGAGIAERLARA